MITTHKKEGKQTDKPNPRKMIKQNQPNRNKETDKKKRKQEKKQRTQR